MANNLLNPFSNATAAVQTNANIQTDQQRVSTEVQVDRLIAKQYPRDCIAAMDRILNSCSRPSLANVAVYSYAKGGNNISGPSIRLAEAIAQAWGNIKFGIREIDQVNGMSIVQAYAHDNETGTSREITFQVPHIRHTKNGSYRLEDPREIYELVANQGARRLRTCVLSIIPGDVIESALNQCEVTMKVSADTSPEAIQKMLSAFESYGVTKEQIEQRIQRRIDSVLPAQIISLKKIYISIKDKMSIPADWFEQNEEEKNKTSQLIKEKLNTKKTNMPPKMNSSAQENVEKKEDEKNVTPALNDQQVNNFLVDMEKIESKANPDV